MNVELGKLTALRWEGGARRWSLERAPSLVYTARQRLRVVFRGELRGEAAADAREEYRRTHWGDDGGGEQWIGVIARGPFHVLGRGLSITYTTAKGTPELVDWVHEWGEGARGAWRAPVVVAHVCGVRACKAHGLLALRGGTYRVTARGIVG